MKRKPDPLAEQGEKKKKKKTTYVHTKICTPTFVAALFINTKAWKQPRYPSADEWTNRGTSRQWNIITQA